MQLAVIAAGFVIQVVAWRAVATGRASVWRLIVAMFGIEGVVAAVVLPPIASGHQTVAVAVAAGAASGLLLWAGTLAFVAVTVRWQPFRAAVAAQYERAAEVSMPAAIALSILVAVPGEELFWRNLVQRRFGVSSEMVGAAVAWLGYVAANTASGSLPLIAGAVVGGAVWGGLAWWSGGIAASLASHGVWTALMMARPPSSGRAEVTPG